MKPIEIEAWALRILELVRMGAAVEDSLVELKAEWPDPKKAARQIAGHSNAARGAEILWLVGANEKLGVKGANYSELSSWYPRVEAEFDGVAPALDHVNVPVGSTAVAALCFNTQRAPYVVRNPTFNTEAGGPVSLEVPWREGTRTRTARRVDLIRLLVPIRSKPSLDPLEGTLTLKSETSKNPTMPSLHVYLQFYIAPRSDYILVFPFHKMSAAVTALELSHAPRFGTFILEMPPHRDLFDRLRVQRINVR